MVRQASDPAGQFAIDFADYHAAAERLAAGRLALRPRACSAARYAAQGTDRYRYPPPFAQLLLPARRPAAGRGGLDLAAAPAVADPGGGLDRGHWRGGARRTPSGCSGAPWRRRGSCPSSTRSGRATSAAIVALVVSAPCSGAARRLGALGGVMLKLAPVALAPAAWLRASRRTRRHHGARGWRRAPASPCSRRPRPGPTT